MRERLEMRSGIVIACPRNSNIIGNYGVAFFLELLPQDFFQRRKTDAHHM